MKTKKTVLTLLSAAFLMLLLSGCGKEVPTVAPEPTPEPTPEPIVKKYLVEEHQWEEGRLSLQIEWNEDFSQVKRVSHSPTGHIAYQIDYDFTYYGNDSIHVELSMPAGHNFMGYAYFFSRYTCYMLNGKIDSIAYYSGDIFANYRKYEYDDLGRLISHGNNYHNDYFVYDGENAKEGVLNSEPFHYDNFGEGIHPYYTFPYLLISGNYDYPYYITTPLWKNEVLYDGGVEYEYDEDNYVTTIYWVDSIGNRTYSRGYKYATKE